MKQFKQRASSGAKLLVNPRVKTEVLSETTKSHLQEWAKQEIYGTKKDIKSKYIDKGNTCEDQGIDKAIEWLDLPFVLKNERFFEDDHFCGTPDIITEDEILDTKISWDCFTFPLFESECPTKDYTIQLQIYMHLTGKKKARVIYVLLNTPDDLVYGEPVNYDHLDKKYRIKTFSFQYDETIIETLKDRVVEARKYLTTII